ncbi:MAG TPA: TIGR04282 family arsenosugar biosynthesis glycosyltransferase [Thermoanaerobaculia bacterium]|nr:TIGR04282 family arsenosugar biosynthesis glycosyltransferase [Thermoanaerobaculia bacterium]
MFPTVAPPANRLLVFARLPERGKVKTRLAADVGDDRALAIYNAMLRDVLEMASLVTDESHEVEVLWAPTESANAETLRNAFGDLPLAMQTGNDLGDRLSMAFSERFFFHRTRKIVVIGVDDPTLPRELIDHAYALLDSAEWVIGPATDGGYYLLGCRAMSFDAEIFRGIEWGTSSVLAKTLEKIANAKASVALLPERSDIDTAADLQSTAWHAPQ